MNIQDYYLPLSSFGYGDKTNLFGPGIKETFTIYLVLEGQGKAFVDQTTYKLRKGDLLFVKPDQIHQLDLFGDDSFIYCYLSFDDTIDKLLFETLAFDLQDIKVDVTSFQQIMNLLFKEQNNDHLTALKTWRNNLLAKLFIQELYLQKEQLYKVDRTNKIALIKDYIHTHYYEDLTVEGISNTFDLNRSYFCRLFKEVTGVAPKEYLLEYKIEKATTFLHNPNLSVEQVSQSVGYLDVFNFSKMYKKKTGLSPQEYRKKNQI